MITHNVTLSADRRITPPVIYAVQGDTGRTLRAGFRDYIIPAGSSATINGRLPSGTEVGEDAVISGQIVTGALTDMLAEAGRVPVQVEVDDGKTVTSFALLIVVQADLSEQGA